MSCIYVVQSNVQYMQYVVLQSKSSYSTALILGQSFKCYGNIRQSCQSLPLHHVVGCDRNVSLLVLLLQ